MRDNRHDTVIRDSAPEERAHLPAPVSRASPLRRLLSVLGIVALAASALFGGNAFGLRERFLGSETPEARPAAMSRQGEASTATTAAPRQTLLRSQPWWQGVRTLEGVGTMTTPALTIADDAVQWRVKWSCQSGRLVVQAPGRPRPLVDARCPGSDAGYATTTGPTTLEVKADGPWQLQVEQQLDVPLHEPPLPAMTAPGAVPLTRGAFYRIDQVGRGDVTIYRLADGGHALRLEEFYVSPNVDLEIHLSPVAAPQTTEEFTSAPSATVARLDVTAGSMNFAVPKEVDPRQYQSVVIWCPPLHSAYAAATLRDAS